MTTSPLAKEKNRKSQLINSLKPKKDEPKAKQEENIPKINEEYEYSIRQKLELEKWSKSKTQIFSLKK